VGSSEKLAAANEGAMEFALKDDTLRRLTASGVKASLGLNAPPGPYKERVATRTGREPFRIRRWRSRRKTRTISHGGTETTEKIVIDVFSVPSVPL
jgi:hypothetical protein